MSGLGFLVIGIIVVIFMYVVITYNGSIKLKNSIEEAFSAMDEYLKKMGFST